MPGSEDEQYDVVCLPVSDMNEFNLEMLFNSSYSDSSSMELDEGEPASLNEPDTDRLQTQPSQPDSAQTPPQSNDRVFNAEASSSQAQSRVRLRRGPFQPKPRSSSSKSEKRNATSPKASDPPKVPKTIRKSTRSKSEVDYHEVQHRYDDIIQD